MNLQSYITWLGYQLLITFYKQDRSLETSSGKTTIGRVHYHNSSFQAKRRMLNSLSSKLDSKHFRVYPKNKMETMLQAHIPWINMIYATTKTH